MTELQKGSDITSAPHKFPSRLTLINFGKPSKSLISPIKPVFLQVILHKYGLFLNFIFIMATHFWKLGLSERSEYVLQFNSIFAISASNAYLLRISANTLGLAPLSYLNPNACLIISGKYKLSPSLVRYPACFINFSSCTLSKFSS